MKRFNGDVETGAYLFSAKWCGPCQVLKRQIATDESIAKNVTLVDGDDWPSVAKKFKITHYPTLIMALDGKEVSRPELTGLRTIKRALAGLK